MTASTLLLRLHILDSARGGFAPSATRAFVVLGDGARLNLTILGSYSQIGWFCTSAANIHCQHGGSVSFMWQEVSVLATPATEQMLTEYVNHWWVKTLASVLQLYISLGPIFYLSRVTTPAENTDAAGNVPEVSVETSGQLTDSYRGHWLGRHVFKLTTIFWSPLQSATCLLCN